MCTVPAEQSTSCAWTGLTPASGRLLVASTTLNEATFARAIVYLLEHDGGGTVGVVLNRPTRAPVGQVLPDWHDVVSEPAVIFGGGPVLPDGALCLAQLKSRHADEGPSVRRVAGGLATVDLDGDVEAICEATTRLRVFAGHSGWAPGQLADELGAGSWYVVDGLLDDAFTAQPATLWRQVLRRQPVPLRALSTYPRELAVN
jgi:putative transcriptional regulator